MNVIEEHYSPDRLLRLIVTRDDDGELSVGFAGYSWHIHGDILARLTGVTELKRCGDLSTALLVTIS